MFLVFFPRNIRGFFLLFFRSVLAPIPLQRAETSMKRCALNTNLDCDGLLKLLAAIVNFAAAVVMRWKPESYRHKRSSHKRQQ
jgi:hypothetical protein